MVPVKNEPRSMPSAVNVAIPRPATMATSVTTRSATSAMHAPVAPRPTRSTRAFAIKAICARLLSKLVDSMRVRRTYLLDTLPEASFSTFMPDMGI